MLRTSKSSRSLLIISFVTLLMLLTGPLSCAFPGQSDQKLTPQATPGAVLFPRLQGLYEGCAPTDGSLCLDRLKQMGSAGFKLVLNYRQLAGTAEEELTYANQVNLLGMKIIWAMNNQIFWDGTDLLDYYSGLAKTCKCSDNEGFIRYVVNLVKDLPATWGYYIGDEVSPRDHDRLKVFTDLVKQIDPSHPRLFIAGASSPATAHSHLVPFVDTAEVIGVDYYPVGSNSMSITATGNVARIVQSIADQNGKQSAMVLQAFSWAQIPNESGRCSPFPACAPFPTEHEMHQMLDLTISNSHPSFILWYSYFEIVRSDNPAHHWADLVAAARN